MKILLILAPALLGGAWLTGAFGTGAQLTEAERRARCTELETLAFEPGFVGERLDADVDAGQAIAMAQRGEQMFYQMKHLGCEAFQREAQAKSRADRAAEKAQRESYEWGLKASENR